MNRNVHRQIAEERGVDIREPSTANLFIDSTDRDATYDSNNFTIVPGQQLIAGAFTRAAVQEVVMQWGIPNISVNAGNNKFIVNSPVTLDTYYLNMSGDVSGIPDYYDPVESEGGSVLRNPIILVNGLPTTIYPDQLPLLDPAGAPIDIENAPLVGEVLTITLQKAFRTVAATMNAITNQLTNASTGSVVVYTISGSNNFGCLVTSTYRTGGGTAPITITSTLLSTQLGIFPIDATTSVFYPVNPNIMPWSYVDITCEQLTYCQDVKDSTTNKNQKDVLFRWYFSWTGCPAQNDQYGFPILQGYQVFDERRNIAFPKQIKWDPIQTVANITCKSFVCTGYSYLDAYQYIPVPNLVVGLQQGTGYEFQMTLLLSEV